MDTCCRQHDLCPIKIRAYEAKYNITNNSIYTKYVPNINKTQTLTEMQKSYLIKHEINRINNNNNNKKRLIQFGKLKNREPFCLQFVLFAFTPLYACVYRLYNICRVLLFLIHICVFAGRIAFVMTCCTIA